MPASPYESNRLRSHSQSAFADWTGQRNVATLSTNAGSACLPFQGWRRFKEAFVPELIARAVNEHPRPVSHILDPFGGSGTTALAAQFLRIHPSTIEVNPYLADLIESKLMPLDPADIASAFASVISRSLEERCNPYALLEAAPKTFVEPGIGGRWIFNFDIATEAASLIQAIESVANTGIRRLFRVLLGPVLVETSNTVVSGKGRRYRGGWQTRRIHPTDLRTLFKVAVGRATRDIARYAGQRATTYDLLRGDARNLIKEVKGFDLAVYSPPYPNSFDYTDVYNIELWMLGYLRTSYDNRQLRDATLSSHVQLYREYAIAPSGSQALDSALTSLDRVRSLLWNRHIPRMIGSYFAEMLAVIESAALQGNAGSRQWLVVGDSRYAGVDIPVASILAELARSVGLHVVQSEAFRSMRVAPQQGGRSELPETLLVLAR